jgi:hypothetical protein
MLNEMEWAGEELDGAAEIGQRAQAQWEKLKAGGLYNLNPLDP